MSKKVLWVKVGKKTWDLESGVCPWGHPITECAQSYKDKDQVFYRCSLSQAGGKKPAHGRFTPYTLGERLLKNYPADFKSRTIMETVDQLKGKATIVFVCSHIVYYHRRDIYASSFTYPGDLFCVRCDSWKVVHSVTAADGGLWIYNPLES